MSFPCTTAAFTLSPATAYVRTLRMPDAKQIIPLDSLRDATDEKRASERFRLGKALPAMAIESGQFPADTGYAMMRVGTAAGAFESIPSQARLPVGAYRRR